MNDSHFHYLDKSLPKGRGEGQRDAPENLVEALTARFDCAHCIETGQGEPRKRPERVSRRERELEAQLADKDAQIAALRARIEGRPDLGTGHVHGTMMDPDEEKWREQERLEDEERERKRLEREAEAAARAKKGK